MKAALLLAVLLPAASRAETRISLPLLPIHARLDAAASSKFCSSAQFKTALQGWAFGTVFRYGEYSPTTDLVVACAPFDAGRVQITVSDRDGREVEKFKSKVTDSANDFEGIGFLVARRLAKGGKTIEAALVAHRANLRHSAARRGAQAFESGDWATAADSFYLALESDADPAPLYYGLYVSHAKLGDALRARWYLLVYCEAVGKRPDELSAEQLSALRGLIRAPKVDDGFAAASLSEYRRLARDKQGAQASFLLKDILKRAPWTVEGYEALADAYDAIDWGPLEDGWRARGKLARKAANRKRNHESLLQITDPQ